MTANKYLQKILEIHGLDIKTIGGRSNDSNIEDKSIVGGIPFVNRFSNTSREVPQTSMAPEAPLAPVSPVDINNNVSCINDTQYMNKVTQLLFKL